MKLQDGCYMRNIIYATNREQEVVVNNRISCGSSSFSYKYLL